MGYTHGNKWTDELIEQRIRMVVDELGLKRFPTHTEMEQCEDGKALAVKISKSGGTKFWAKKLGFGIKDCESEVGEHYEIYALKDIYEHTLLSGYKNKVGYPYDLTIDNNIKVDVKASHIVCNNNDYHYYSFNLEKKEPTCDIFLLYCINNCEEICKTYIIPSCFTYGKTQVGISANRSSKWDKLKNAWFYFEKYNSFYNEIMKGVV